MNRARSRRPDLARRTARFRAPDEIVLLHAGVPLAVEDVSETGMCVTLPADDAFKTDDRVEFKLIMRDPGDVAGWHVFAVCIWVRNGQAGFRFDADAGFSRDLYARLTRMSSERRTKVIKRSIERAAAPHGPSRRLRPCPPRPGPRRRRGEPSSGMVDPRPCPAVSLIAARRRGGGRINRSAVPSPCRGTRNS